MIRSMKKTSAVEAGSLIREYSPGRGVTGVDLDIEWGECYALLGRNGSGKSTLTRLLLGLERPDGGAIRVAGINPATKKHLSLLGSALDTSVHWDHLSGWNNAWFVASSYRLKRNEIERRLGDLFALADLSAQAHDPVSNYSFGMRRKLSLVEAICHEPQLLVLDEPTSGVDAYFTAELTKLIERRCRRGLTTWIAANDPEWVARVATRVAFMDDGKIICTGTIEELLKEVAPYQTIEATLTDDLTIGVPTATDVPKVRSFDRDGREIVVVTDDDPALVPKVMEWIVTGGGTIESVQVRKSSLRDVFLLKTGKELEEVA